ncbi:MAG TPA: LysR substrate-binding domain-containing protein [Rubrivivax sp.]|nr:LysR substrate-binding domain-containing protein [Rubrivivax sp.]
MASHSPRAPARRRPIGLTALRGFDAAARHLSFTVAAQELKLTQSSISRQIAALERQLGKALFVRRTRALLLTPAGAQLQQAVRQALATIDQSVDAIRGGGGARRLTLSTYASFASLWLAPRLAQFQSRHPDIEIRLDASDRVVDLQAEDVDLAIRWVLNTRVPPDATLLIDDVLAPAISPRLLQGLKLRRPADLAQWPLLDLDTGVPGAPGLNWAAWFDYAGAGAVAPAAGRLVFSFVDQSVQAAVRGQGVALVRSPFLQDCVASGDLLMPFPHLRMPCGYRHVLVLNPEAARRPHVEEFVAWLREQFARAPQLGA